MIARRSRRPGFAQVELVAYLPCLALIMLLVVAVIRLGVDLLRREEGPIRAAPASNSSPTEAHGDVALLQVEVPSAVSLPEQDDQAMRAISRLAGRPALSSDGESRCLTTSPD